MKSKRNPPKASPAMHVLHHEPNDIQLPKPFDIRPTWDRDVFPPLPNTELTKSPPLRILSDNRSEAPPRDLELAKPDAL